MGVFFFPTDKSGSGKQDKYCLQQAVSTNNFAVSARSNGDEHVKCYLEMDDMLSWKPQQKDSQMTSTVGNALLQDEPAGEQATELYSQITFSSSNVTQIEFLISGYISPQGC